MSGGRPVGNPDGGRPTGSDRDIDTLRQLVIACDMAADLVSRGRASYDRDLALRLASEAIMNRLREGLGRLSDEAVAVMEDGVPTTMIRGMRNRVVHEGQRINYDIVWTTLERDIPLVRHVLDSAGKQLRGS